MYSFAPLPIPEHSYVDVYVLSVLAAIIVALVYIFMYDDTTSKTQRRYNIILTSVSFAVIASVIAFLHYDEATRQLPVVKNEQVIGVFKGYIPSGYEYKSGKSTHFKNAVFGIYVVPEGEIIMELRQGVVYPERAIIFKN